MKRIITLVLLSLVSSSAFAADLLAEKRLGLGIAVGGPSGLSGKYWLGTQDALDVTLGFSSGDFLILASDYLVHFATLDRSLQSPHPVLQQIRPYAGIGGLLLLKNASGSREWFGLRSETSSTILAVRVPIGLEWTYDRIGAFLELVPHLGIFPATVGMISGSLGVRYYF